MAPTIDPATGLPRAWGTNPVSDVLNSARVARRNQPSGGGFGTLTPNDVLGSFSNYNALTGPALPGSAGLGSNPSTINIGGGSKDWASLIENDPAYIALKNALSAQGIADAAHLRGAIQQALINFGDVPQLPSDVLANSGLDTAGTKQLAENNPFSLLKRLAQNAADQEMAIKNQLAARGALSSGETGYQLGRLGHNTAQNQYDLTNNLLGNIDSLEEQYAQGQRAAAQQLAQGALTAENTAASSGAQPGPTVTATWNPATGTYVDPSGNHYDPNGNPIALPPATTPSAPSNTTGGLGAAPIAQYDPTRIGQAGTVYGD